MEKEANTVSKSPQSFSLPDCQGKERREPRICTGGSLKAQTKKKKGRLMSGDHGCRTSHLHPGSQAAEDLLVTVPGKKQHSGGTGLLGAGHLPSRQAGEGESTAKTFPLQSGSGRPGCQTGSPGLSFQGKAQKSPKGEERCCPRPPAESRTDTSG